MGNRFGLKDLLLLSAVGVLIFVMFLAMKQFDRQWDFVKELKHQSDDQTKLLARIANTLERGVRTTSTGASTATSPTSAPAFDPAHDPFAYARQAKDLPGYATGDTFVRGITNMEKITPIVSTDTYARYVEAGVLETLAQRDARTLEWVPLLARDFSVSPDGLSIKFHLRPEATFSDGSRVTVDDVVFSYQWIMNPDVEAPRQRAYYAQMQSVEKTGDDEVTFKFKEPYFKSFDLAAGMEILSKSFYGKFTPAEFNKTPGLLFGSGPYRMVDPTSWAPGKPLVQVRNERYWGAAPAIDRVVFKEFASDLPKVTDFRNGDSDYLQQLFPEQYVELLKDAKLVARTRHFEYQAPTAGYRYVAWNERRNGKPTFFADKRVRQALTMLIDRKWIADDLSLGYASVITGPFMPGTKQCDSTIAPWPFDPPRAKALLKEAGFEDRDGSGALTGPDGQPFKFQLTYPSGNQTYQQMVLFFKDSLAKAGIQLEPNPLNWSVFGQKLKNRDFEAITLGWSSGLEIDLYQAFHSDQIKDGGDNMISYANPELDKLIDQARHTVDEPKRMELWHKAHRVLHEDQPYTFLVTRKYLDFIDGRFKNVQVTPLGLSDLSEWYVPTTDQRRTQ